MPDKGVQRDFENWIGFDSRQIHPTPRVFAENKSTVVYARQP